MVYFKYYHTSILQATHGLMPVFANNSNLCFIDHQLYDLFIKNKKPDAITSGFKLIINQL
jgi:hypothetical protein